VAVLIDAGLLGSLETVIRRLFKSIDAHKLDGGEATRDTLQEALYVLRTLQDDGTPENGAWTAGFHMRVEMEKHPPRTGLNGFEN
jgi:hypothetical protein